MPADDLSTGCIRFTPPFSVDSFAFSRYDEYRKARRSEDRTYEDAHMEQSPESSKKVKVTKAVMDGIEAIRTSGATNMLDRPTVQLLAWEWGFEATAEWLELIDSRTYGRLIFQGPDVIDDDTLDEPPDENEREDEEPQELREGTERLTYPSPDDDPDNHDTTPKRLPSRDTLVQLGKRASLAIADSYETEGLGVLINEGHRAALISERTALMQNLAEAANLEFQLRATIGDIYQGIETVLAMIDPENY